MTDAPLFPKGYRFTGPGRQYYELTRSVERWERLLATDFTAGGGAPPPIKNGAMPDWLARQLKEKSDSHL